MFSLPTQRDFWMFLAPASVFLFYLGAWFWIGPEPAAGPIVARYDPPEGLSAAGVRFVGTGLTDGRSLAAVIAQLAVRGCVRVEPANGKYKLSRLLSDRATESALAREEKRVLCALFEDGPVIELSPAMDQRNNAQNGRYILPIHDELKKELGGKYLTRHSGITSLAVLATFVFALSLAATAHGRDAFGAFFFTLWILFCGFTVGVMVELSFASAWKTAIRSGTGWVKLLPGTAAIAVFGGVIVLLLTKLAEGVSPCFALTLAAFLAVNLGCPPWLKRRTALGRQTCDQIAGFRLFLEKVEQERLDRLNPAAETPQELDHYLPFAIALEVKEEWGDRLAEAFLVTVVAEE